MKPSLWIRAVANTVNLSTPVGLLIAAAGRAQLRLGPDGLVFAERYRLGFPIAGAFTVGNVVIVPRRTMAELVDRHADVVEHEDAHAWQYSYCLGLPFLPAYTAAMAWSWLRTGDRASGNFFERQANLAKGGYDELPTRSIRQAWAAIRRH